MAGRGGRQWGAPINNNDEDLETEATRGMTNQQIYAHREQKLKEQEDDLDYLYESVIRQKAVATTIGEETDSQIGLLGRLDSAVDRESARIKVTTNRVTEVEAESSTKCLWITICLLALLFIGVLLTALYT